MYFRIRIYCKFWEQNMLKYLNYGRGKEKTQHKDKGIARVLEYSDTTDAPFKNVEYAL